MKEELKNVYKDIDLRFTAHPITGDVTRKTGIDALLQSIRNLVMTAEGEFLGELEIGGGTFRLLFRNNTPLLSYTLQSKISETIKNHEPRVRIKEVNVFDTEDKQSIFVSVVFYALAQEKPFTEMIQLTRLR